MRGFLSDLRISIRSLARSPGYAAGGVLTLALGLGGTIAMFAVLDRVVLDPLPYPDSDRLVRLANAVPGSGTDAEWNLSTAQYFHYRDRVPALEDVGLFVRFGTILSRDDGAETVLAVRATASVLEMLGAGAAVGRLPGPADDRPDAPPVVVLSHGYWQRAFGGDSTVVGTTLTLQDTPFEVVGVLEPDVTLPPAPGGATVPAADLWTPLRLDPAGPFYNSHVYPGLERLAPGATVDDLRAQLDRAADELPTAFPTVYDADFFAAYGFRPLVRGLKDHIVGGVAEQLWILLAGVGLVLVVACADVANLLLARAEARRREMAVRTALGAGPWVALRQFLAEGGVLAALGGGLGLAAGVGAANWIASSGYGGLPRLAPGGVDPSVLLFALGVSTAAALVLSLVPVLRLRAEDASPSAPSRSGTTPGERRFRGALVLGQVAFAIVLVVGAGLLVESFQNLRSEDPGVSPEGVLTLQVLMPGDRYPTPESRWAFYRRVLDEVEGRAPVTAVGVTRSFPFADAFACTAQAFEDPEVGARLREAEATSCGAQQPTSAGYFEAMGIDVIRGRTFEAADHEEPGAGPVVVSRAFAERYWPGEDPIGKGVAPSGRSQGPFYRVVGVVEDVYATSVEDAPSPVVYYPIVPMSEAMRDQWSAGGLALRTGLEDPASLFPVVREVVAELDPDVALADPEELSTVLARSRGRVTLTMTLLLAAAATALTLAAVGLFGTLSYLVARRTREIGVRIALGATRTRVQREVTGEIAGWVGAGAATGLLAALLVSGVLRSFLYEVRPTEPVVYLAAGVVVAMVAVGAGWLPARRATRIHPREALRVE